MKRAFAILTLAALLLRLVAGEIVVIEEFRRDAALAEKNREWNTEDRSRRTHCIVANHLVLLRTE